jgi:hypothetical protein
VPGLRAPTTGGVGGTAETELTFTPDTSMLQRDQLRNQYLKDIKDVLGGEYGPTGVVSAEKAEKIQSLVSEAGGMYQPDGYLNMGLIRSIQGIMQETAPMTVGPGDLQSNTAASTAPTTPYAHGGIATGPKSGYKATLHGTEAIIPLNNNKSIPVEIKDTRDTQAQLDAIALQTSKLAEIAEVMKKQVSVSENILRYSQN